MRPFTQHLFFLRCKQLGFSMEELDFVTVGRVLDLCIEQHNDHEKWPVKGDGAMLRQMFMH